MAKISTSIIKNIITSIGGFDDVFIHFLDVSKDRSTGLFKIEFGPSSIISFDMIIKLSKIFKTKNIYFGGND